MTLRLVPTRDSLRRRLGAFYTPGPIVEHLLDASLEPALREACAARDPESALLSLRVCDPSCGDGRFLLAAGLRLAARLKTLSPSGDNSELLASVCQRCLFGVDLDPVAVELAVASLAASCGEATDTELVKTLRDRIQVGDALLGATQLSSNTHESRFGWSDAFVEVFEDHRGFDVVVGNPPYLNQLQAATATERPVVEQLGQQFGAALGAYTDTSAVFMLLAARLTRPGGRACLLQPQSLLAARDSQPVRRALLESGSLESLWVSGDQPFVGVGTSVCAPTLVIGPAEDASIARWFGERFMPGPAVAVNQAELRDAPTWAHLATLAPSPRGAPATALRPIGEIARATADFRDQYYGLTGMLIEDASLARQQPIDDRQFPPLVTAGLIDLADCKWGRSPTRIHKQRWRAPRIDRGRLERETKLGPWLESRLVPKVLLATQTRVIEVIVDEAGTLAPSVPVITITPSEPAMLWHIAAALASPLACARAVERHGGTALSSGAIKLSATQAMELPCPQPCEAWDAAAEAFREASHSPVHSSVRSPGDRRARLTECAKLMLEASGLNEADRDELLRWWLDRQ